MTVCHNLKIPEYRCCNTIGKRLVVETFESLMILIVYLIMLDLLLSIMEEDLAGKSSLLAEYFGVRMWSFSCILWTLTSIL